MLVEFQKVRYNSKKTKFSNDLKATKLIKCELSSSFYYIALNTSKFISDLLIENYKPNKTFFYLEGVKRRMEIFDNLILTIDRSITDILPDNLPIENVVSIKEYMYKKFN
jgi:hypothetical protein